MDSFASFREGLYKLVEESSHIVITAHLSPDDDSIGSVMAMHEILTTKYPEKDIKIIYSAEPTERHDVFAHYKSINFVTDSADHIEGVDLLVVLDVNQYARISKQPDKLIGIPSRVVIDHHKSAPDAFTLSLIDTSYSSNAELVYRIFADDCTLTPSLASSILLGILGDTGNFSYVSPAQTDVFVLARTLVQTVDMSIDQFRSRYGGIPKQIIPLLQELVAHTTYVSVDGWPDVQYSYIDNISAYTDEDMSAASHIYMGQYLPKVKGYGWGFVITPRTDGTCRMSGRSLPGSVNVRDLHERMSIGGGHDRASGGYFTESDPTACIDKVLDWMKANKPLIG